MKRKFRPLLKIHSFFSLLVVILRYQETAQPMKKHTLETEKMTASRNQDIDTKATLTFKASLTAPSTAHMIVRRRKRQNFTPTSHTVPLN
jgi:hypothetical protein